MSSSSSEQTQDQLKQQGNAHFQEKQYRKAIDLYTKAIDKDPNCEAAAAIFSNRALCYFSIEEFQKSFDYGKKCSQLRPTWMKGYLRTAVAAEQLEAWEEALESYSKCLEIDPSDEAEIKSSRDNIQKIVSKRAKENGPQQQQATTKQQQQHQTNICFEDEGFDDIEEVQEKRRELSQIRNTERRLVMAFDLLEESVTSFNVDMAKVAMEFGARLDIRIDPELETETRYKANNLKKAKNGTEDKRKSRIVLPFLLEWVESFHSQVASGQIGPFDDYPSQPVVAVKRARYCNFILDTWIQNKFRLDTGLDGREVLDQVARWGDWGQTPPSIPQLQIVFTKVKKIFFNTFDEAALQSIPRPKQREFASLVLAHVISHGRRLSDRRGEDDDDVKALIECIAFCMSEGADPSYVDDHVEVHPLERMMSMLRAVEGRGSKKDPRIARYQVDPEGDIFNKVRQHIGSAKVAGALRRAAASE